MSRLIPRELIPNTLWDEKQSLMSLPPQLISSWVVLLEKNGLLDKAKTKAPQGFEGGMSKEDTDDHFAWRYTGSSARVMLSMLDPHQNLFEIPDVFTQFFSGNRVFLADLPCGSGAASISILSVYCELRKQGLIPREPLDVIIVGGELSEFAQSYARDGLTSLISELEKQAIFLEFEIIDWDVCDPVSTTELIKCLMLKSQGCSAKVILMANFSGFLHKEKKWKDARDQIEELFRYNLGEDSVALWIEPNKNNVTNPEGFFQRLIEWFQKTFSFLQSKDVARRESSVQVKHPLLEHIFKTRLVVIRFDLYRRIET